MGTPKWRLPYGDTCVLGAVVAALERGGANSIALAVRPDDLELCRWAEGRGLLVGRNPEPERGMLSSVLVGIDALGGIARWAAGRREGPLLVCPADLPALTATTVRRLLEAMREGRCRLAVPTWEGRRGHPLAVGPERVAEIAALDPAVGLRALLERHPEELLELPVEDPGCVLDVDAPEDYERLRGHT
jgi:molybdenum cofactor cytidylyltransferase